ncbi:HSPB1-associated protein 1 isoform X2 [Bombina bombina]|nr:HSPB1-associated protein 1 isoform X2 [Bombina bombina]
MVSDWPALHWKTSFLSCVLEEVLLRFRIGRKKTSTDPQFETQCEYVHGTLKQFDDWVCGLSPDITSPFSRYDISEFWVYADYKYLAEVFKDKSDLLQDIVWADFGFPGRDGQESTIWIGSTGANTPCHLDTYGCNLVLQVEGRKTWYLFPPENTAHLYPTRIPYEESSIFSKVNIVNPDSTRFPLFSGACPHVVTLHPGQVLFVPRHWWHYVECVDEATVSVNTWIELDADHEARVEEAITRMLVFTFKSSESSSQEWLNPTEEQLTTHHTNLQYLNSAVSAYMECHSRTLDKVDVSKQDREIKKRRTHSDIILSSTADPPFGEHLMPVLSKPSGKGFESTAPSNAATDSQQQSHRSEESPCSQQTLCIPQREPSALGADSKPSKRTISSDEVLDCLVNPQVMHLVAELLLQKQATKA